ncbi:MAG: hypothetical protein AAF733_11645 [Verrucomicrobiota bacterium]
MTKEPENRWKRRVWTILRHFPVTGTGGVVLLLVFVGWFQSGRYSERRLHYFGTRSAEVFTASSLIRVSVVDGYIDPHGRARGYRQRNVRGRIAIRPLAPSFRITPSIWELTLGFWHLALLVLAGTALSGFFEGRALRKRLRLEA